MVNKNLGKNKKQFGFTLTELLVVISIISFLASVLLVAFNNTRIKGRDATRVAGLEQVQKALEFYYADHGHYPITRCGAGFAGSIWTSPDSSYSNGFYQTRTLCDTPLGPTTAANINAALAPYMAKITDPKPDQGTTLNGHWYESYDGTWYRYQIVGYPENMSSIPTQYVDTMLCALPILSNGNCSSGGTDPVLSSLGYSWIHAIMITSDRTKTSWTHASFSF